jgi:hypothetical protein
MENFNENSGGTPPAGYSSYTPSISTPSWGLFATLAIVMLLFEWTLFEWLLGYPLSFVTHLCFQFAIFLVALFTIGHGDPDRNLTIATIFTVQTALLYVLNMRSSSLATWTVASNTLYYLIGYLAAGVIVMGVNTRGGWAQFSKQLLRRMLFLVLGAFLFVLIIQWTGVEHAVLGATNTDSPWAILYDLFMLLATSWWLLWALANSQSRYAKIVLVVILLLTVVVLMNGLMEAGVFQDPENNPIENANSGDLLRALWHYLFDIGDRAIDAAKDQVNRTMHPDFEAKVERTQGQNVGIRMGSVRTTDTVHFTSYPLILHTIIEGTTIDVPVNLSMSCSARRLSDTSSIIQGSVEQPHALVTSTQSVPLICEFAEGALEPRSYKVKLNAVFGFETSSYIRRYVMDKSRVASMQAQQIDPLEQYGIQDATPQAIHTPGPIILGISTTTPLIAVPSDTSVRVPMQMKIENNYGWAGKLLDVQRLTFMVPKGFVVDQHQNDPNKLACSHDVASVGYEMCPCAPEDTSCLEDCQNYNLYAINPKSLKRPDADGKLAIPPETFITCTLRAQPAQSLLRQQPILITSLRAHAAYNYSIYKETSITMKKMDDAEEIRGKPLEVCGELLAVTPETDAWNQVELWNTERKTGGTNELSRAIEMKSVFDRQTAGKTGCFSLVFGLIQSFDNSVTTQEGCTNNMRCGRTRYSKQMLEEVRATVGISDIDTFEAWDDAKVTAEGEKIANEYLWTILKPACASAPENEQLACMVGKYACGKDFVYGQSTSADGYYYCHDVIIPRALTYAAAFEKVES